MDFASYTPKEGLTEEESEVLAAYGGKSEGEILRAVYERAAEGKRNGTLSNEQIDAFCAQIAPMLDAAKRKKLKKIAEKLKSM